MLLGALVGLWLLSSFAVAYWLTSRSQAPHEEPVPVLSQGHIQPFRLVTSDGEDLGAWFLDGRADRPLILLLHGNGGHRRSCLKQAELLVGAGCSVLLISFRAHGDSTGRLNDFGYSARRDVAAAVAWLEKNHPGRPILVWGRSLGAAAAVFSAADLGPRVGGYILECPYRDLRTALSNRLRLYLPLGLDRVAYAGMVLVAPLLLPDMDRISPLEAASGMPENVPVLILAGSADRRAHPDEARAIHQRLKPHSRLVIIEGGGHLDLATAEPDRYKREVLDFLEKVGTLGP